MKTFTRILPLFAIIAVLGGAIYYVRSQTPQRPEPVQVSSASPASQSLVPPSDRYAQSGAN